MERGAGRPSRDGTPNRSPWRDDDIHAAMRVRVRVGGGGRVREPIVGVRGGRRPVRVLPHDQGFVQGVETVSGGTVEGAQGEGLLVAFGVGEGEGEGVCDVAGFFEAGNDVGDEVFGGGFGRVREDDVGVAAFGFAAPVAAYDDALKS